MPVTMSENAPRSVARAVWNGLKCRCPNCGKGRLFRSYLKVADSCENCGEEFFHHRADDFPPYISIVIVGHVIVGLMLHLEFAYQDVPPWIYLVSMVPAAVILPLVTLPSIKGAVVGLQWANKMYGFDPASREHTGKLASPR
ncbi:MAG TPA: DUF983 domain-containing protein [Devosia sp.]|jgi:uncharacterized protein (DUF983 family)|nr:DUF983 domain-containing protein [Devosia sp.]